MSLAPLDFRPVQAMIGVLEAQFLGDCAFQAQTSFFRLYAHRASHGDAEEPLPRSLGTFIMGGTIKALADVHVGQEPIVEFMLWHRLQVWPSHAQAQFGHLQLILVLTHI
jgi:hypothetical protein